MAHVIKIMASEGIFVLIYLDDLLIISPTLEKCLEHRDRAIAILEGLGWLINTEKSRQQPAQTFDWLGVHLDLVTHTISATQNSMDEFKAQLYSVLKEPFTTKRSIMRLQGLAVWIGQSNPMARILIANTKILLQKLKYKELDTPLTLSNKLKISIVKWVHMPTIPTQLGSCSFGSTILSFDHAANIANIANIANTRQIFDHRRAPHRCPSPCMAFVYVPVRSWRLLQILRSV